MAPKGKQANISKVLSSILLWDAWTLTIFVFLLLFWFYIDFLFLFFFF